MQMRRFRLIYASEADAEWLCELLNRLGAPLGTQVEREADLTPFRGAGDRSQGVDLGLRRR